MNDKSFNFRDLAQRFSGELHLDDLLRILYATDASAYRILPSAVAIPKTIEDLKLLVAFAHNNSQSLIPRAAGTSLAGQCVGNGIVVDTSKYFTRILEFNKEEQTVKVQPGVVRDELNEFLKPHGLFFGPNTSTSNRCMIGGMVGNNSSGTTSIKYGVTRDKVRSLEVILSDGSEAIFEAKSKNDLKKIQKGQTLESKIYKELIKTLIPDHVRQEIKDKFPKKNIHRRNTGYALDAIIDSDVFENTSTPLNMSKLICGSEGTLALTTAITLELDKLPPQKSVMIAAHFKSIKESLLAVVHAMRHDLYMCELMDKTILDCTKNNREQSKNRFFIQGDPEAILMLEVCADDLDTAMLLATNLVQDLKGKDLGYAFPLLEGDEINSAINLRKAGLGLLGNIVGDKKAVPCIEDTAVEVNDLPAYIDEFTEMMDRFGQKAVYYAHAGAGELHLRPILNLKKKADVDLFRRITHETALLVKKYKGSFSGEHGDGIVRAEFIPIMIGEKNYDLLKKVKQIFDPNTIFNPGKIVDALPMDQNLRYQPDRIEPRIETVLDFSDSQGILRAAEKCNGSGDCRKPIFAGGTMCPSYRATKNEKDTTRARANALRELLTHTEKANRFDHQELKEVFDLCLSCKACASECPSNVDVALLKAEFQHQYYKSHPIPLRDKVLASNAKWSAWGSKFPKLFNTVVNSKVSRKLLGITTERNLPKLSSTTFMRWYKRQKKENEETTASKGSVYLFIDEFTNFYDVNIGIDTLHLLSRLGYHVQIIDHEESGRSYLSKGILDQAKSIANKNIELFKNIVEKETPLVGIEPSAILGFKDEYLRLAVDKEAAESVARFTFTIEEFIANEIENGNIDSKMFSNKSLHIKIHGHCHQKALSNISYTQKMLSLPINYSATIINSGCCGMAGSFGYEKEHYEISMRVGEDLFNRLNNSNDDVIIAASGTSCRHQIWDGTAKKAVHPVAILKDALL